MHYFAKLTRESKAGQKESATIRHIYLDKQFVKTVGDRLPEGSMA